LHPLLWTVEQGRLRRSSFPEAAFDAVERTLDVSPSLPAHQRQLFGARLLQP
jgi:hypothetical protein